MIFEEFFMNKFLSENPITNRIYLPIQWTCFYISRNYGKTDLSDLESFLNSLPKNQKYFTVVQWDDGILNNTNDIDILKFASGGIGDYAIPLINLPHKKIQRNRNIFASFIGVINGRHKIREKLRNSLKNYQDYYISEKTSFDNFKEIMESSIFSLCPRGYGKTSFRINESLNLGSIPVYIYDEPWIPFNDLIDFKEYGVLIHESEINNINEILKSFTSVEIEKLQKRGAEVYNEYFTYDSCYKQIIKLLN